MRRTNKYFSVIVPIYQVEDYLEECINSVLKQTFGDFELILVDDGSKDKCPAICDEYEKRDRRIKAIHKNNGGLSDARNAGLDIAAGCYILFLDSDDYWADINFLDDLYKRANETNADCIIYSQVNIYADNTPDRMMKREESLVSDHKSYAENLYAMAMAEQCPISAWSKAVKADVIESRQLRFIKGILSEDIDWSLWIYSLCSSVSVINKPVYGHRVRGNSISQTVNGKHCMDIVTTIRNWEEYLKEAVMDETIKACLYNFLSYYTFLLLALSEIIPKEERKQIKIQVYQFLYLTRKGISRKNRLCRVCYVIFGKKMTAKLFMSYIKLTKKKL